MWKGEDVLSKDFKSVDYLKIGIIGCGHLGQAIALSLLNQGFNKKNLLITYGGNPYTYQKLESHGLTQCLSTNLEVFYESEIVLITIKPQDICKLAKISIASKAIVVSCMAGVSIALLNGILKTDVYRMMFSGPDTIISGKGVATMYPESEQLKMLLTIINITYIKVMEEDDMDIFTAGVCMPAALLMVDKTIEQSNAIARIEEEYPLLSELIPWAEKVLPSFQDEADRETYVKNMITKGGITDAIINSLENHTSLDTALRKGITRSKEIAFEIHQAFIH